jgi:pullulanase
MWDKLKISRKDASNDELIRLNKLTAAIIFTAQGATFIQSGEEFARSKNGDDNSYKSPDSINELKWDAVHANIDLLNYYKGLIALKNTYGAFSYSTKAQVDKNIKFLDANSNIVAFRLIDITKNSEYSRFIVIYNGSNEAQTVDLGEDKDRDVLVNELSAQDEAIDIMKGASVIVPPKSALVLGEKRK